MSNTSNGRGKKGSKFWMQIVVEEPKIQNELNNMIGSELRWISPLAGEDEVFQEYELRHKVMKKELGITNEEAERLFSFWPQRQPQWDGIARSKDGKILYLVEAKAHLDEMKSKLSASNDQSIAKIKSAFENVHNTYYGEGNMNAWIKDYYQLANRLTFLNYLNKMKFKEIEKVKLVLLNFVNDITYKSTSEDEWNGHYEKVFTEMTGKPEVPEDVMLINFKVSGRGITSNPQTGEPIYTSNYQSI